VFQTGNAKRKLQIQAHNDKRIAEISEIAENSTNVLEQVLIS